MKKLEKFLLENIKTGIAFVIGVLVASGIVYASTLYSSSNLLYNNSQSGLVSTTAIGALDELYEKVNNVVPIDPDTFQTNLSKTVYASSKGVCIYWNSKLNCFKINNFEEESNFPSDMFCDFDSSGMQCTTSNFVFSCAVWVSGAVRCFDNSNLLGCSVDWDGSVYCDQ